MSTWSEIYNTRILELASDIPLGEPVAHPDGRATAHSKLCGSTISVSLTLREGRVSAYGQTVKACLLGQAAASVMGREIVGSTAEELRQVGATMRRMLKEHGSAPSGRWADLGVLESVRDYKARHASTLLVFDAVEAALAEAEPRTEPARAAAG